MRSRSSELRRAVRFSKRVVIFMLAGVGIFTLAMTVIFCVTGDVPDTLITEFFGFFGVEGGVLGVIKVAESAIERIQGVRQSRTDERDYLR